HRQRHHLGLGIAAHAAPKERPGPCLSPCTVAAHTGGLHRQARRLFFFKQKTAYEITNICFVIDNQNVTCHGSRLCCQLPVAAIIFVWFSIASAGCVVSVTGDFVSSPSSLPSGFGAWPDMAKRNRIQAPRWPGRTSAASLSSIRPPWSSRTRPTIASPSPVPFSRVVT